MTKEIISSKDLHLYYGKKEALKGIDLSFNQGGNHCDDRSFWLRKIHLSAFFEPDE